jgi:quinol monooxygenase YgiN
MMTNDRKVWEIAQIDVLPGTEDDFEKAVAEALPLFDRAAGCDGAVLRRSVENPSRYRLFVTWETVEHHTVTFRQSPDFAAWRGLVGKYFAAAPEVEHVYPV